MGLIQQEPLEVYCQFCGKNITNEGGDVGDSRFYCHGDEEDGTARCVINALFETGQTEIVIYNYHNPRKIQKMIRKGELIHFGPLEKEALNS